MKTKFLSISNKSLDDLGAKTYEELWNKLKGEGYNGLTILVKTEMTLANADDNKFHAVFSTSKEDRHGEIVFQNWDLKAFKDNPVYLDSHNYDGIEHILGRIEKIKADKQLEGDIIYALDNPKGLLAFNLTQKGFLNTSSVGFIPKDFDKNGNILKSELLEISAVSVPANGQALIDNEQKDVTSKYVKVDAGKVIANMALKKIGMINKLSKAVAELTKDNRQSQRREIFKALRNLQDQILQD